VIGERPKFLVNESDDNKSFILPDNMHRKTNVNMVNVEKQITINREEELNKRFLMSSEAPKTKQESIIILNENYDPDEYSLLYNGFVNSQKIPWKSKGMIAKDQIIQSNFGSSLSLVTFNIIYSTNKDLAPIVKNPAKLYSGNIASYYDQINSNKKEPPKIEKRIQSKTPQMPKRSFIESDKVIPSFGLVEEGNNYQIII
jgi:hypothetical protein